jgi:hypothetical protein
MLVSGALSEEGENLSTYISVVDPKCLSGIPDPNFFHPRSSVKKIPDPGSASASKNLSILAQKIVSKLSEI